MRFSTSCRFAALALAFLLTHCANAEDLAPPPHAGNNSGGSASGGAATGGASFGGISSGGTLTGGFSTGGLSNTSGGVASGGTNSGGVTSGGVGSGGRITGGVGSGGAARGGASSGGTSIGTGGRLNTGGTSSGGTSTGGTTTRGGSGGTNSGGIVGTGGGTGLPSGSKCAADTECTSHQCVALKCAPETCSDAIVSGNESDQDCGGSCKPCALGMVCNVATDCQGSNCSSGVCGSSGSCASGWATNACASACLTRTQDDQAKCKDVLDCYVANNCGPTTCGSNDGKCGANKLQFGGAPYPYAQQVYDCMCN